MVLADGRGIEPSSLPGQQPINIIKVSTDAPDAAVSNLVDEPKFISNEILQRQSEIDKYLFEEYAEEINKKDFIVTYTGPFDDYIEIGITPYNEENAMYLYSILGEDKVKVVEGQQAELYTTSLASDAIDIAVTTSIESDQTPESNTSNSIWTYAIGGAMLIGGSLITKRKF